MLKFEQKGRPLYDFLIVKATPYLREQRARVRACARHGVAKRRVALVCNDRNGCRNCDLEKLAGLFLIV